MSSCLAVLGFKTLCIDFDSGLRNLDISLGMNDFTVRDYMDVLNGQHGLVEACSECPNISNLFFLAAPTVFDPYGTDTEALKSMFDEARREFDFCFIDSPSGIGAGFRLAHTCADVSIIVTIGEFAAIRGAQQAAAVARDMGVKELRLLVNRVRPKNFKRIKANIDDVIDTVCVRLLAVIPEDKNVFRSLHENTPLVLYKNRRAAYDYLDAARRLSGEEVPLRQV
jgi:septum site-determining protein MinD